METPDADWRFCPRCGGPLEKSQAPFVRYKCVACGKVHYLMPKVGVGLLIAQRDQVLLARRAEEPCRGMWGLPSGYVEYEETLEEAAIREGQEELSVTVSLRGVHGVYSYRDDPRSPMVYIVFRAIAPDSIVAASDVAEAKFFALDSLPHEIAFEGNRRALDDLISKPR